MPWCIRFSVHHQAEGIGKPCDFWQALPAPLDRRSWWPEGQRGSCVAETTIACLLDLTELRLHIEIDALRRSIRQGNDAWSVRLQLACDELSDFKQPIRTEDRTRCGLRPIGGTTRQSTIA